MILGPSEARQHAICTYFGGWKRKPAEIVVCVPRHISTDPSFIPSPSSNLDYLLTPEQRSHFSVCCQKAQCHVNWPVIKNSADNSRLRASWGCRHLCDFPVSTPIIPCNWQDRGEHHLRSRSFNQAVRSLLIDLGLLVGTSSLPTWEYSSG